MDDIEGLEASKRIAERLSAQLYEMIGDGVEPRPLLMGLLMVAFDMALDVGADQRLTRVMFMGMCDAVTLMRLEELGVPDLYEE
ncbi:MAG: hypothetical protein AAFV45_15020 [Pseudomonadota bacterium]